MALRSELEHATPHKSTNAAIDSDVDQSIVRPNSALSSETVALLRMVGIVKRDIKAFPCAGDGLNQVGTADDSNKLSVLDDGYSA